jgi:ABC-2 type transport system ATP-binding protein
VRALIVRLNQEHGKTVLLSSHLLQEIEVVATHVVVLHQGQTVVEGAVPDLLQCAQVRVRLLVDESQVTRRILAEIMETVQVLEENNGHFVLSMSVEQVPLLNRHLVRAGVTVRALVPMRSLEAYFLSIT